MVLAKNLTAYFNINESLSDENNQAMAHTWGEGFQYAGNCGPYTDITDISNSKYDPPYFCRRTPGQQEFAYRFKEYNPNDTEKNYPYFTNRIITVSSGACFKYNVPNAKNPGIQGIDPLEHNYTFFNSTYTSSICIPKCSDGWSATIYIYRGTKTPVFDEANSCGDRCKWIWAYRAWGPNLTEPPAIFECPITVSEVSNTTTDAQQIPDSVARVAAASIALQGQWTGAVEDKDWTQYQFNAFKYVRKTIHIPPILCLGPTDFCLSCFLVLHWMSTDCQMNTPVQIWRNSRFVLSRQWWKETLSSAYQAKSLSSAAT